MLAVSNRPLTSTCKTEKEAPVLVRLRHVQVLHTHLGSINLTPRVATCNLAPYIGLALQLPSDLPSVEAPAVTVLASNSRLSSDSHNTSPITTYPPLAVDLIPAPPSPLRKTENELMVYTGIHEPLFQEIKAAATQIVEEKFPYDNSGAWDQQNKLLKEQALTQMKLAFSILGNYKDNWFSKTMLQLAMKNRHLREKRHLETEAQETIVAALATTSPGRGGRVVTFAPIPAGSTSAVQTPKRRSGRRVSTAGVN